MLINIRRPYCQWRNTVNKNDRDEAPKLLCCSSEECNRYFAYYIVINPKIETYKLQASSDNCSGCQSGAESGPDHLESCNQHIPF